LAWSFVFIRANHLYVDYDSKNEVWVKGMLILPLPIHLFVIMHLRNLITTINISAAPEMLKELLKPDIEQLIDRKSWTAIKEALADWPPAEIVDLLYEFDKEKRALLFRALPRDIATDVFVNLEYEEREELINVLTQRETKYLIDDMEADDRTSLLEELPAKVQQYILNMLPHEELKVARTLLGYPEDSIGRHMTPNFVKLRRDWTVGRALEHIRRHGKDMETIYRMYVISDKGQLLGEVLLRDLVLSKEDKTIEEIMADHVAYLSAFDDQEEGVRQFERHDVTSMPVVDSQGALVGIVTFDDIYDISEEEVTEDFQRLSGVNPVDKSYLAASKWLLYKKRVPWLIGLCVASFLTAAIISGYSEVTAQLVALTAFIPMIIGTAGNTGTQSSTLMIRALSTGEVEMRDAFRIFRKELIVGLSLGLTMSLVAFVGGFIDGGAGMQVSAIVSISMILTVTLSNIFGNLMPMLIHRMGLDPAVISSPLITTIMDMTGAVIYYSIAMWFLKS
jgi:magnesium transporter